MNSLNGSNGSAEEEGLSNYLRSLEEDEIIPMEECEERGLRGGAHPSRLLEKDTFNAITQPDTTQPDEEDDSIRPMKNPYKNRGGEEKIF